MVSRIDDYRHMELQHALEEYRVEMANIANMRLELTRQENDCWSQLEKVLLADDPEKLSPMFRKLKKFIESPTLENAYEA